jgi:hypothetical protein
VDGGANDGAPAFDATAPSDSGADAPVRADASSDASDATGDAAMDAGTDACALRCYPVYAHSDHVLYRLDLTTKSIAPVGPFNAPMVNGVEDVMTDLAVAPAGTIYTISRTNLYTADPNDGHVTLVGPVTACGQSAVALTFDASGKLFAADFQGAFCAIDLTTSPPTVSALGTLGQGLAIAGDLVAVSDGTMYGTAYKLADGANGPSALDNYLVTIDPTNGSVTRVVGQSGFPKLLGIAYDAASTQGRVIGFTHDGSGRVTTIDPTTGVGTLFGTFNDPTTSMPIMFAGAGVNAMVPPM